MGKTTVYGHCAAGCRRPVVAKEELTLVTREEYAELEANGELVEDCVYVITNDTTVEELANRLEQFNSVMKGEEAVPKAEQDGDGNIISDTYVTKDDGLLYTHLIIAYEGALNFTLETHQADAYTGTEENGDYTLARILVMKGCDSKDKIYPASGILDYGGTIYITYGVYAKQLAGKWTQLVVCQYYFSSDGKIYTTENQYSLSGATFTDTVSQV